MSKIASFFAIVLITGIILVSCSTSSDELVTRNASALTWEQSWNNNCAAASFDDNHEATLSTTLGDLYLGSNFSSDLSTLNIMMSAELGYDAGLEGASQYELYLVYIPGGEIEPE
jgi:hypothetical protein